MSVNYRLMLSNMSAATIHIQDLDPRERSWIDAVGLEEAMVRLSLFCATFLEFDVRSGVL